MINEAVESIRGSKRREKIKVETNKWLSQKLLGGNFDVSDKNDHGIRAVQGSGRTKQLKR